MNQIPCVPIVNPYQVPQTPYMSIPQQQSDYNAVKIDIHNPTVGTGAAQQPPMPYYTYPQAPIYNYPQAQAPVTYPQLPVNTYPQMPQMPVAYPQAPVACPEVPILYPQAPVCQPVPECPQVQQVPQVPQVAPAPQVAQAPVAVPTPVPVPQPQVIQQQNINVPPVPVQPQQVPAQTPEVPAPVVSEPAAVKTEIKPEVVPSEPVTPQVDFNSFIAKLTNPDFDVQAAGMEEIANMIKETPDKATELVDTKVFDALTNIVNVDSSALEGPTQEQVVAREKIMTGKEVTDAEKALANVITPKEQAERNKSYALFTTAMMQKLYADEVARLSNQTVPLTELPGIATVVDNLKDNPNPLVRASAIEALSYIQNPAYKNDLTTVFSVAQNDSDAGVAESAKAALERLNQV